jgi:hypothetical protein
MTAASYEGPLQTAEHTSASEEVVSKTGGAGWGGKVFGVLLACAIITLKLSELGQQNSWSLSWAPPFIAGADWSDQWRPALIIVLEGLAAAAAITIAFGIFVSNSFTSNVSTRIVNRVKHAVNEETRQNLASIRKDVAEFKELLIARQADPEHLRLLNEFLEFARDNKIAELSQKLRNDDELINKLATALSEAVRDLRSRPS